MATRIRLCADDDPSIILTACLVSCYTPFPSVPDWFFLRYIALNSLPTPGVINVISRLSVDSLGNDRRVLLRSTPIRRGKDRENKLCQLQRNPASPDRT